MKVFLDRTSIDVLMQSKCYRTFILTLIAERKKHKRFGYSDIARIGGFSARSFPREVAIAKKHLTLKSLPKMIRGLGIPADLAEYFRLLVEAEEPDCRIRNISDAKLLQMLSSLKKRILSAHQIQLSGSDKSFVFPTIPLIYAALGNLKIGSGPQQISIKTSIPIHEVLETLQFMLEQQIIERKGQKYFAKEIHVNLQGLHTEIFKKHFIKIAETSIQMSKQHISSEEKLFLSSAFSVSKSDLPRLKDELRSILLKFADAAEDSNGDKVVSLLASFF